jgi:hypothetical protein
MGGREGGAGGPRYGPSFHAEKITVQHCPPEHEGLVQSNVLEMGSSRAALLGYLTYPLSVVQLCLYIRCISVYFSSLLYPLRSCSCTLNALPTHPCVRLRLSHNVCITHPRVRLAPLLSLG